MKDLADKAMHPVTLSDLKKQFENTGWELIEVQDLSDKYEMWYHDFLQQLKSQKDNLLLEFTEETYDKVYTTFSSLLDEIEKKQLGGAAVYAKLKVGR